MLLHVQHDSSEHLTDHSGATVLLQVAGRVHCYARWSSHAVYSPTLEALNICLSSAGESTPAQPHPTMNKRQSAPGKPARRRSAAARCRSRRVRYLASCGDMLPALTAAASLSVAPAACVIGASDMIKVSAQLSVQVPTRHQRLWHLTSQSSCAWLTRTNSATQWPWRSTQNCPANA